jgi:hypothetical protein
MTEDVGVDLSWLRRGDTVVIEHAEGFTIGRYLQTRQSIVDGECIVKLHRGGRPNDTIAVQYKEIRTITRIRAKRLEERNRQAIEVICRRLELTGKLWR